MSDTTLEMNEDGYSLLSPWCVTLEEEKDRVCIYIYDPNWCVSRQANDTVPCFIPESQLTLFVHLKTVFHRQTPWLTLTIPATRQMISLIVLLLTFHELIYHKIRKYGIYSNMFLNNSLYYTILSLWNSEKTANINCIYHLLIPDN